MDEGRDEISIVSSDRPQLSVRSRRSPLLPSSGWMAKMQQRGRSHTPRPTLLSPEMLALLTQRNQWLGLFVPSLDQSRDAQHLSYKDLPEQTQIHALYLRQIRQRLGKGEKLRSEDTKRANELIKSFIVTSTETHQHVIARIEDKFASSDDRQKQTEAAIETAGAASWNRDKELAQEILGFKNQLHHLEQLIIVLGMELVN